MCPSNIHYLRPVPARPYTYAHLPSQAQYHNIYCRSNSCMMHSWMPPTCRRHARVRFTRPRARSAARGGRRSSHPLRELRRGGDLPANTGGRQFAWLLARLALAQTGSTAPDTARRMPESDLSFPGACSSRMRMHTPVFLVHMSSCHRVKLSRSTATWTRRMRNNVVLITRARA